MIITFLFNIVISSLYIMITYSVSCQYTGRGGADPTRQAVLKTGPGRRMSARKGSYILWGISRNSLWNLKNFDWSIRRNSLWNLKKHAIDFRTVGLQSQYPAQLGGVRISSVLQRRWIPFRSLRLEGRSKEVLWTRNVFYLEMSVFTSELCRWRLRVWEFNYAAQFVQSLIL